MSEPTESTYGYGNPRISVVIPTHNRADLVVAAIRSVLEQTLPPHEVIVVDDASTDETLAALGQFAGAIRVLRSERNIERGAARNLGAREATGDYVAFLDSDDSWDRDKLRLQSSRLRPRAMCLTGVTVLGDDGREQGVVRLSSRQALRHLMTRNLFFGSPSSMVIHADAFAAAGGFPEDRSVQGSEDWLFLIRAARASIEIDVVDQPLVRYLVHGGNSMGDPDRMARAMWSAAIWLERHQMVEGATRRRLRTRMAVTIAQRQAHAGRLGESLRWVWKAFRWGSPLLAVVLVPTVVGSQLRALAARR